MSCMNECRRCHEMFLAVRSNVGFCPSCRAERQREYDAKRARARYAKLHPKKERFCAGCGKPLESSHAERCQYCASVRRLFTAREYARKKREEARAARATQPKLKVKKTMDEAIIRSKQANVKIEKAHIEREKDARQKAAEEEKRIAAGVDMLKAIYARRQALKRRIEEKKSLPSYPCVCEGDCPAWTRRDWW